jgi:hypothetical protein
MKRELLAFALMSLVTVCWAGDVPAAPEAVAAPSALDSATAAAGSSARSARPRQVPIGAAPAARAAAAGADAGTGAGATAGAEGANPATTADKQAAATDKPASAEGAPKFASEAKWELAGYNNDEVVYTVFVTSQDSRIIRCTTQVKGFYFENGAKLTIADRQITTVFPNQPTRVGYWMDMDQQSGATYSVQCHPV